MSDNLDRSNIEFKAHVPDRERLIELIKTTDAEFQGTLQQRDTFFHEKEARLKLRVIDGKRGELIRYQRSNEAGPRQSRYSIRPVKFPAITRLLLGLTRGTVVEVIKERQLWLWRGVRIHVDRVEGLGDFMELEAVVADIGDQQEAKKRCEELMRVLHIEEASLVSVAYADLLLVDGKS